MLARTHYPIYEPPANLVSVLGQHLVRFSAGFGRRTLHQMVIFCGNRLLILTPLCYLMK